MAALGAAVVWLEEWHLFHPWASVLGNISQTPLIDKHTSSHNHCRKVSLWGSGQGPISLPSPQLRVGGAPPWVLRSQQGTPVPFRLVRGGPGWTLGRKHAQKVSCAGRKDSAPETKDLPCVPGGRGNVSPGLWCCIGLGCRPELVSFNSPALKRERTQRQLPSMGL